MSELDDLLRLARRHGLETRYVDASGIERAAEPERLMQVLSRLGVEIRDPADAAALIEAHRRSTWRRRLDPVVVAWDGRGDVVVRLPAAVASAPYRLRVRTETGEMRSREGRLEDETVVREAELDGVHYVARRLPLPENLPAGYATVEVELGRATAAPESAMVLCAPRRVHGSDVVADPAWGVFLPLYALNTERSRGVGDFTDLQALIDWTSERGGRVVGTLPLLASFLDEPCEPSPYTPVSRLAWNELYIDPARLEEVRIDAVLRERWDGSAARAEVQMLRRGDTVDFRAAMAHKHDILWAAAERCFSTAGRRRDDLEAFVRARPELDAYARFRAVAQAEKRPWPDWPIQRRNGDIRDGDFDPAIHRYHLYAQYNAHLQLQELSQRARHGGLGLYLDLPVGVHPHGFDMWRERDAFVLGLTTGAPPDPLFEGGQNWAFPPLHPERLRADRYRHFIDVLRNHLRYAGVLRIDHVMGLHRLFVIPEGAPATDGVYIRYRPEELYAILSIESHRTKTLLIGENLGTVPPRVEHAMDAHGVHGMHVLQYACRPDHTVVLPPAHSGDVASLNTHDMPPFRAFFMGQDIEERRGLGWLDARQARLEHDQRQHTKAAIRRHLATEMPLAPDADADETLQAALVHLGRSAARLVLINVDDLLGDVRSQNVPGTWRERPNWSARTRDTFESWRTRPFVTETLRRIHRARDGRTRAPEIRYDVGRVSDEDLRLLFDGAHRSLHECLGAHPMSVGDEQGTHFAVWAPGHDGVRVTGDFEGAAGEPCMLQRRGDTDIWEAFVVGAEVGDRYAFVDDRDTTLADPLARRVGPPDTTWIAGEPAYDWGDAAWMNGRTRSPRAAISIYEVHLGSWRRVPEQGDRPLGFRELGRRLADHAEALAFTHVLLVGAADSQHPWATDPHHGGPLDLMAVIDGLHQRGIGVFLAIPPVAVPHDVSSPAQLHAAADSLAVSSAGYWVEGFHADGIRIEPVAPMTDVDYSPETFCDVQKLDAMVGKPLSAWTLTIHGTDRDDVGLACDASWPDRAVSYFGRDPIHRRHHHDDVIAAPAPFDDAPAVSTLGSHAIASGGSLLARMDGDEWQSFANLRLLYGHLWTRPGKKLLFMGQEFGQRDRWSRERSLDWHLLDHPKHAGLMRWVADLNRAYRRHPALHELDGQDDGFVWIVADDAEHGVVAYERRSATGDVLVVVGNFTPVVRHDHVIGVNVQGAWDEILNGDADAYGGSGVGNFGRVWAQPEPAHGRPWSLRLTLPPLAFLVLQPSPTEVP